MRGVLGAALRLLFMVGVAYPVVLLWLGIHVRHRERLPWKGPAIIAANHNSHLDILTLLSLFPLLSIPGVQPAAAADYFFKTWWLKWFSLHVIGIIPVVRGGATCGAPDPLAACYQALDAGKVLVIFPEGTRGQPEQMAELKAGIWHLAQRFPHVPVVPVYMHGLGKAMPKGTLVPVPFYVQVAVGKAL
ncbi:MAG TPA: lysophospholipid acyltransferase family protein [Hymenobacter sp.]|jgi:1-acyl-sn-glycerol-3-phosphate acyltransferase